MKRKLFLPLNALFSLVSLDVGSEKAFGLDRNDVIVEQTPLVYQPMKNLGLTTRKKNEK